MGSAIGVNDRPGATGADGIDRASNMEFTSAASGCVAIARLTTMPSKQSIMGKRYTLPAGIWNSVISVSRFSLGVVALKKVAPLV